MQNSHGIQNEHVLVRTDERVELEIKIPKDSDFFDGHFPQFKLLPAVAQFELVSRFARSYFAAGHRIAHIRRMKFSSPILPDSTVFLSMLLNREKQTVTFEFRDAEDRSKVHSSGVFSVVLASGGKAE